MEIDQVKLERQLIGRDRWFDNNCQGIIDYATGVGKTFTAHLCIKRLELEERGTYIIVVPSEALAIQWSKGITDSFPKHLNERILILSAQGIAVGEMTYECGTLIIDEIHEFHTDDRLNLLNGNLIKTKRTLGLTASGDDKNFHKILKYLKIVDYISNEEAIEKGFVADFIEYNLALDFTKKEKESYDYYTDAISKNMPKFQNDIGYAQKVLTGGKTPDGRYYSGGGWAMGLAVKKGWSTTLNLSIQSHKLIDDLWNPAKFIGYANVLMNAVRARKNIICNAQSKVNATVDLVKKFNKVKTIIFSEDTKFADRIGVVLNEAKQPCVVYHSSLKTKTLPSPKTGKYIKYGKVRLKREALDAIRTGRARILSTAKSLDKGLDIPDIRFGITASGSQNPTQYKQRRGRSTRKEDASVFADVPILLVNLFIINSQDEIWLKNRQSSIKHTPIQVDSITEITYVPPPNFEFTINDL